MENDGQQFEEADDEYTQYRRSRIGFLSRAENDPNEYEVEGDEEEEDENQAPPPIPEEVEKAIYKALHARHGEPLLDKMAHVVVTLMAGLGGVGLLVLSASPMVNASGVLLLFAAIVKMLRGR